MLWYWLRRDGVFQRKPGWGTYLVRLVLACVAMAGVLLLGLHWIPDFTTMDKWHRIGWLLALVGGGGAVYVIGLLALGFRPRDLREH
jgi:putative peptidoglycan lipid II flippase